MVPSLLGFLVSALVRQVSWNDGVLVVSLLYMCIDIQYEWDGFSSCRRPIHKWLLLSYGLVVLSRLVHVAGALMCRGHKGKLRLNLRQKSAVVRLLLSMMWLVILPAFTVWSMVGTAWVWEVMSYTPQCLPGGAHFCVRQVKACQRSPRLRRRGLVEEWSWSRFFRFACEFNDIV
eukprot:Skav234843  [mRNA]  locus=scaffold1355:22820:27169:+ [translate_table: standard]